MSDNSPVPEWFGRTEEERRAAAHTKARGLGCALVAVLMLAGAGGYWALQSQARVDKLEQELARAREREAALGQRNAAEGAGAQPLPAAPADPTLEPGALELEEATPEEPAPEEPPGAGALEIADGAPQSETEVPSKLPASTVREAIKELRPTLRSCYQSALNKTPDAEGTVRVRMTVKPDGRVETVKSGVTGSLPDSVAQCISAKVKATRFPKSGGTTTIAFPVVFASQ